MANKEVAQAALDRAEEEKNLLLVYQPIHDARTREVYGAEALMRQRRRTGEIREASVITTAAEEGTHEELFALDSWALRTALSTAAAWPIRINVNLSPREFQEGNVVPRLTELLTGCGFDPRQINLEITETAYIRKPHRTTDVLTELKKLGIELWLDDFGTGHSTMEHLQQFPVDGLKLSSSFIKGLRDDHRCRAITRALIALAHDLQMKVIAEGVEHEEQVEQLLDWQCDYIQGFLFSKPMTAEDLDVRLRSRTSTPPAHSDRAARRGPSSRSS
ncbi:MAG TPA: EAL domain-containing protein [Thermoanaerobaculia bacterium]|nr:EAL domain-containing protein [Thermoanaerobaculia bacterium]